MKVFYPFYNLFLYLLIDREDFTLPFLKVDLTRKYCNIMKINIFISLVLGILISGPITAQTEVSNPFGNALIPDMMQMQVFKRSTVCFTAMPLPTDMVRD